jgi:signal transduction histidine kinase
MPGKKQSEYSCFIAVPYSPEFTHVREAVIKGVEDANFRIISLDRNPIRPGSTIQEAIINELAASDCIAAVITNRNPNVFFEVGLARAMGKGLLLIAQKSAVNDIPFDLREFRVLIYDETTKGLSDLIKRISKSLFEYRKFPQRLSVLPGSLQIPKPFFTDWERLGEREVENLCRELLAQMGFQHLEWGKFAKEIDLVAELPRKDPDGFEYRELWLISLGIHVPIEISLKMVADDAGYFLHRIFKYSERFEKNYSRRTETPVTFLSIFYREYPEFRELERFRERLERRRLGEESFRYNIRLRTWDREYLTSLVQKFPQIGYKYFSDEGRIRSTTRKSYEDLYKENSELVARQAELIAKLEDEKNRRIRAERDSVWKDISFSAAHKIGNPIFAIETDLDPLVKRVREQRTGEAEEVVNNIRSSVEKAKAFVEQFKSLARSQEIKQVPTALPPIFDDIRRNLCSSGIDCQVECPPDLVVFADPDRLAEVFDELVANAKHWFDKPEKKFELKAVYPAPEPIPGPLDSTQEYVLIHVKDNGCGIPVSNKQRIFDAFFTTFDHGTGLGLALVRRIIEGHGGTIMETGIPGQGADFEIYLPVPPGKKMRRKPPAKTRSRKKSS